ncbi:DUF349 domain-containing protein [Alcanivorax sp. JB21]|uniref:DUF349 domain-containing protein n=1 Tax=Alcanivorax limicola TaxID=2874102 RepID=UPI001CC0FAF8|nr:DUF349 domain-containing protein [Alcanivorax limicola]MBZ2187585.1 DUF349 domain-containing protein [Alcanivorax limicola]
MLGKLFKPRWQHNSADQRLRAIGELSLDDPQTAQILTTLARGDSDASVRAGAAGRLHDFKLLDQLVRQDPDNLVRDAAALQINRLLAGLAEQCPGLDNRLRLVRLTDNQAALAFVARSSPDGTCRIAAIERLDDETVLLDIALHGDEAPQRIAAAARLRSDEALRQLVRDGRDKRVLQQARERLKQRQQAEQAAQSRQTQRDAVLAELTQHARRTPDALYGPRLTQLCQQWQDVASDADTAQTDAFHTAEAACRAQLAQLAREAAQVAERRAAVEEQQAAVAMLTQLHDDLDMNTLEQDIGSLRAAVATQQRRWEEAITTCPAEEALAKRYAALTDIWTGLIGAMEDLLARREEIDALTARLSGNQNEEGNEKEDARVAARALLQAWPVAGNMPPLLAALTDVCQAPSKPTAAAAEKNRPRRTAEQEALDNILGALQRELRQRNLRHANRLCHKAEGLLAEHPDSSRTARLDRLRPQLDELRDWHAFAAEPKKPALCERMEALADTNMDAEEKASAIQALHDEWRALMSSDQEADQALWDRFKAASDNAYEPCRAHFREQDAERSANLARRAALCDQLSTLLAQQDWEHGDLAALFEIRRKAPDEFKQHQPVRFTDAREVGRRFSDLLTEFDRHLTEASERHAATLEALTTEVEALCDSDDLRAATEHAKQLQQQWKQAGWVHPQQYRTLHKRFRKACDTLFGRQQEARKADQVAEKAQRDNIQAQLSAFAALLAEDGPDTETDALRSALRDIERLTPPRRDSALQKRQQALVQQARQLLSDLPRRNRSRQLLAKIQQAPALESACAQQRELAVALEVSADIPSPETARQERMRWQLEKLPQAMKQQASPDRFEECAKLLEGAEALLGNGLAPDIRERLRSALEAATR